MSTPPNTPSEDSLGPTHVALAQIVVVGAVLQVLASVALALARVEELQSAIAEGPLHYLLGVVLSVLAIVTVWLVRHRLALALSLLLGWPVIVYVAVGRNLSVLGLAYHGEFILYHFLGLLCVALCVIVPARWLARRELGPGRAAPLVAAAVGACLLLFAHLGAIPALRPAAIDRLGIAGAASLLVAWPLALGLFWRQAGPPRLRVAAALLMLPLALRVAVTGPEGFNGAPVPDEHVLALGICITGVAALVSVLFRPRIEVWVRLLITLLCLGTTLFFWLLYDRGFGELEDGFDGLIRSFLGFPLPYPAYVPEWKVMGVMMAIFFVLSTVYASLLSSRDRNRGLPLTMLAIAGIGLTSPHLCLLVGAGALLLVDALLEPEASAAEDGATLADEAPAGETPTADDEGDVERVVADTAARLGLDAPIVLAEDGGRLVVLRGRLEGIEIDLRARERRRWTLQLAAGLVGRAAPSVELVPDPGRRGPARGRRPPHPIARTHRLVGDARTLEPVGDRILDALSSFPEARLQLWPGGCAVDLGPDLSRLHPDHLEALIRAAARAC